VPLIPRLLERAPCGSLLDHCAERRITPLCGSLLAILHVIVLTAARIASKLAPTISRFPATNHPLRARAGMSRASG
jgi:hypothetical protein